MIYLSSAHKDRFSHLRDHFSKADYGLEIGPFHSPICPKSEGFNVISIDALSRSQLISSHKDDAYVRARLHQIEEVDIVSTEPLVKAVHSFWSNQLTSSPLTLQRKAFDYIVSSHNFEHLVNPIQFLDDASNILKDGGILSMAIPIGSRCFDMLRPITTSGVLIDSYVSKLKQPSIGRVFDSLLDAAVLADGRDINSETANLDAACLRFPAKSFSAVQYTSFIDQMQRGYVDAHCSVFNPYSFQLIFRDLVACGLVQNLRIFELIENGTEFIVHIKKTTNCRAETEFSLEERKDLLKKAVLYHLADIQKATTS